MKTIRQQELYLAVPESTFFACIDTSTEYMQKTLAHKSTKSPFAIQMLSVIVLMFFLT